MPLKEWIRNITIIVHEYLTDFVDPRPDLSVGDHWYVRMQGGSTLLRVKLLDVTEHTVRLDIIEGLGIGNALPQRYAIADLQWVELISGD